MMNFWFETCSPCIAELGALSDLFGKYKDNPNFLFLSFTIDNAEVAKKAVEKYDIPFFVCPVSREEASRMNFGMGFPTNIVINSEKKIEFFKTGGSVDEEKVKMQIKEIENVIAQILSGKP
jgi:thiol-disulfide isomerase/thioredoxin